MKFQLLLPVIAAVVSTACAKSSTATGTTTDDKMYFSQQELTLFVGEEMEAPLTYKKFERGVYVDAVYDFASNPYNVAYLSSDKDVVDITSDFKLKAISVGTATVKLQASGISVNSSMNVIVKKKEEPTPSSFSQDLTQPLTEDMVIHPKGLSGKTMQGFDYDSRGTCYMSWEDTNGMKVCAFNKDGSRIGNEMLLPSGGHGDGFCIEQNQSEVYFWTSGTLGEHSTNGGYSGGRANGTDVRLICRHKFVSGGTQYAEEAVECFYLNDNGCRIVDIDVEHDVMACWTYADNSDYIYIYKYSTIRNASKITKKVERTSYNAGKTVSVYNLNTVTPISKYTWKRKGVTTGETNSGAVQGFCVYDDKVYVESGAGSDEATLVSVMDFKGNILQQLVKLGVTVDKQKLIDLNLSTNGNFEPEGMHIRKGEMYLGFASKNPACVIKLK